MRIVLCVFAVLCLINIGMVSSQQGLLSTKKCKDFQLAPMKNFNKKLYFGTWFMHQLYDTDGTGGYNCYVLLTKPSPNGNSNVTEVLIKAGLPDLRCEGESAFCPDGKGIISFTTSDVPGYNGQYYVLKTDYSTYTIECSCKDVSGGSVIQLYVMSRTPFVSCSTQRKIDDVITASKLNRTAIRTLDIYSCPSKLIGGGGLLGAVLKLVGGLLG